MSKSNLYLQYTLEDCVAGNSYIGVVNLGRIKNLQLSEDTIKDAIRQKINSLKVVRTSKLYIVCQLFETLESYIRQKFVGPEFKIDLSENLGLPNYILHQGAFRVIDYKILIASVLEMSTLE